MISTSSLQAFSGATTTAAAVGRSGEVGAVRLVRAPPEGAARQAGASGSPGSGIPEVRPGVPPPRGSLLNLSV